ncbi:MULTISPECIES: hypothetical protein [unclassified Bartonella]|uniref:hypothetical protein n=1 Tax=unclassified Bartonella TaxID=2645622 RepID=UPI0035D01849
MMKSGRRKPLTAPIIKYDFSYSVNRKTIIFPPLSREKSTEKSSFIGYAAKYLVLMEKFLMWQKTFSPLRKAWTR